MTSLKVEQQKGRMASRGVTKQSPSADRTAHPPTVCFSLGTTNLPHAGHITV